MSARARLDAIEWVRVAAASGVVWFHIPGGPFKQIGHAGLICFVLISVFFQAAGATRASFGSYSRKRIWRIVPPWLFWFGFYGLFNLVKGREFFPSSEGLVADLLTGTWIGLWYFPFILILSPVVYGLVKATSGWNPVAAAIGFLGLGILALWSYRFVPGSGVDRSPWLQWAHALPAVPLGLGLHSLTKSEGMKRRLALGLFLLAAEAACLFLWRSQPDLAVSHGLAVLAVSAGLSVRHPLVPWMTNLGHLCLGVYILHPALVTLFKRIAAVESLPWLLFAVVLASSFAAAAVMRGNRHLARVL